MDFAAPSISSQSVPTFAADTRPAADAAASKKTREPAIAFAPTGMAPSTSQVASVSRSMLMANGVEEPVAAGAVPAMSALERTLKPYGTPMLPERYATKDGTDDVSGTEGPADKDQTEDS